MPVVVDEASEYGYTAENRHMALAFLRGEAPDVTFDDGVEVVELLMTAYMSAEQGRTLPFPPDGLDASCRRWRGERGRGRRGTAAAGVGPDAQKSPGACGSPPPIAISQFQGASADPRARSDCVGRPFPVLLARS